MGAFPAQFPQNTAPGSEGGAEIKSLLACMRVGGCGEATHVQELGERHKEGTVPVGWGPQPRRLQQLCPGPHGPQDALWQVDSAEWDPKGQGCPWLESHPSWVPALTDSPNKDTGQKRCL